MVLPPRLGLRSLLTIRRQPDLSRLSRLTTRLGPNLRNQPTTQPLRLLAGPNRQSHQSTNRLRRPGPSRPNQVTIRPRQPPVRLLPRAGSNQRNHRNIRRLHLPGRSLTSPPRNLQNTLPLPGKSLTSQARLLLSTLTPSSPQALANRSHLRATMSHPSPPWSHQSQQFRRRSRTQASTLRLQCTPPPRLKMRLPL